MSYPRSGALALAALLAACTPSTPVSGKYTSVPGDGTVTGDPGVVPQPLTSAGSTSTGSDGGSSTGGSTGGGIGSGSLVQIGGAPTFASAPGMSLMVADGSACVAVAGSGVALQPCDGTTPQRWELIAGGVRSLSGSNCLAAEPADGAAVTLAACASTTDTTQQFTATFGHLFAASLTGDASLCIANPGGGSALSMAPCAQAPAGTAFILGWDGVQFSLANSNTQCLRGTATAVGLATCSDNDGGQMWTVYGNGQMMLQSLQLCLDISGGSVAEGAALTLGSCTNSASQQWSWSGLDSTLRPRADPTKFVVRSGLSGLVVSARSLQAWTVNK